MIFDLHTDDSAIIDGATELSKYYGFSIQQGGISLFAERRTDGLRVEIAENGFFIYYSRLPEFYLGLSYCLQYNFYQKRVLRRKKSCELKATKICAGNATPKKETLKKLIRSLALMGYDSLILFAEDLFEIENCPYLGSFKKRYSKEDIREIDEYARLFGIELIGGIECLSPIRNINSRDAFVSMMNYGDTLLVGSDATYSLIETLMEFCATAFSSKKIYLGMQATKNMCVGKYGYAKDKKSVFLNHAEKVASIADKYGLKATVWADNLFYYDMGVNPYDGYKGADKGEFTRAFPAKIDFTARNYAIGEEENFCVAVKKLGEHIKKYSVAVNSGVGYGFAPLFGVRESVAKIMQACPLDDMNVVFSDGDGAESSIFLALPTLLCVSERLYGGDTSDEDLNNRAKSLFNVTLEEWNALALPNRLKGTEKMDKRANPCKYLFYNDPLIGICDCYVYPEMQGYYRTYSERLSAISKVKTPFGYLFATLQALCSFLELKSTLGVELTNAYRANDRKRLQELSSDIISECIIRLDCFYESLKRQWLQENHSVGFEVLDVRIGGVRERLRKVADAVNDFLNGETARIEELEQARLPYFVNATAGYDVLFENYRECASGSDI